MPKPALIADCVSHMRIVAHGMVYYMKLSKCRSLEHARTTFKSEEQFLATYDAGWLFENADLVVARDSSVILKSSNLFGAQMLTHHERDYGKTQMKAHPVVANERKYTKVHKGTRIYWIDTERLTRIMATTPADAWDSGMFYGYIADMIYDQHVGWLKQLED